MEVGAAAGAAAAGAAGMGLFGYNRSNYMMDQKNHYTRFTAGLNMAIAQTGMYRQDITDLTNLTVTRQDVYHVVAAMGLTILTAIYCPGRVGLHTPPPPGWLMGLAFLNIAGCYMFLGLTIWLAMHAAMRADTASVHMLTRFVRLPIPSQGMLDKARKFGSSFEEQPLKEIFRIPFTKHQNHENGGYNEDMAIDAAAQSRSRHGFDVPVWYRKEKEIDGKNAIDSVESMMPLMGQGSAPQHFEAYREIQQEWFPYDVYARLSMFLAFMHLIHCWAYLQIGHQMQETRALFACAIVILPMFVLQQIILTIDIIPSGPPIHRLGPFGLWFAYFAAYIEYKRWYTVDAAQIGYVLVYVAYAIHIVYTLALIRLCAPSQEAPAVAETPGAAWWPGEWRLPSAFQHAIWLVAPPKQLDAGLHDITAELRDDGSPKITRTNTSDSIKRADVHKALGKDGESPAWFNVKVGLFAMLIGWVFLTFGFTVEVFNQGTAHPALLSAPGIPNNARDPRYRPAKLGYSEVTEVGTGGIQHGPARGVHMDAVHRRLAMTSASHVRNPGEIADQLRDVLPYLSDLARTGHLVSGQLAKEVESTEVPASMEWPPLFVPELLACDTGSPTLVALSRHGRGALVNEDNSLDNFVLDGAIAYGTLAASYRDEAGLLLLSTTGVVLECPGSPVDGRWHCEPVAGSRLMLGANAATSKVAIVRSSSKKALQAAVVFPGESSVTIFSLERHDGAHWLPVGEVSTKSPAVAVSFTAGADSLLLTAADGTVSRLQMQDGSISPEFPAVRGIHSWHAACRRPSGSLARLASGMGSASSLEPKLFLGVEGAPDAKR